MVFFVGVTQFISYLFYALFIGYVVLEFVPKTHKPTIIINKKILLVSLLGIIVCSFMPIVHLVYFFKGSMSVWDATLTVITDMHQGKLWLMTTAVALLSWITLHFYNNKYIHALWGILFILITAYGSHAAAEANSLLQGMFPHGIHFLAVTLWVGVLLHVAWFSKDKNHWDKFLNWFHSLAWACLILITVSGFVLMGFVMETIKNYPFTWLFTYGQILLLKHISIVPVLAFAFINGYLSKKAKENPSFHPIKWIRIESILLLFTFFFTGIMGNQTPPHIIRPTGDDVPFWLDWLAGYHVTNETLLQFQFTIPSILFFLASLFFIGMIYISFKENKSKQGILMAIGFGISFYLGILFLFTF